ncbi:MAG: AAA family ATPase [Clostridiaceae bacterium]|nr:AAA family ATPase [Clostridiaceae bacterium]
MECIVIASGKGGTGKTTVTAGVGAALAARGLSCLVIDADVGVRSLDLTLGMYDNALFDFTDVAENRAELSDAVAEHPARRGLFLLTAPLSPQGIAPDALRRVTDAAMHAGCYDFVLMDAPAGLGVDFRRAAYAADRAIVVSTPDIISLRSADRTAALLEEIGFDHYRLIVNRVRPKMIARNNTPNIDDAMDMAGLPLLGVVPEDETVLICGALGQLLPPHALAARAFTNIAARLDAQEVPLLKLRG